MKRIGLGDRVKVLGVFGFHGHKGEAIRVIDNFADVVFDDYKPTTDGLDSKSPFRFRLSELERL